MATCKLKAVSPRHAEVELDHFILTFRLTPREVEPKWFVEWSRLVLSVSARTDMARMEGTEELFIPKSVYRQAKKFAIKRIQIEANLEKDLADLQKKLDDEELHEKTVKANEHTHPVD